MKDLNLSRVINVVALTGLAVSVVGCGGDRSLARKYCKTAEKCDKSEFEDEYSSMKDCIDTELESLEDLEKKGGAACGNAARDFITCYADAYKPDCDEEEATDECEDEAFDLLDECEEYFEDYEYEYDY